MTDSNSRLDALRKREAAIKAKIAAHEARQKARLDKERTRLKTLIGSAIYSEAETNPEAKAVTVAALDRFTTNPPDRAFLKEKGWLSPE